MLPALSIFLKNLYDSAVVVVICCSGTADLWPDFLSLPGTSLKKQLQQPHLAGVPAFS